MIMIQIDTARARQGPKVIHQFMEDQDSDEKLSNLGNRGIARGIDKT